jgi:hypothetical protein
VARLARRAAYLLAVAVGVLLVIFWRHGPAGDAGLQHWLAVHTGTNYCAPGMGAGALRTCKAYGYWSGFGSVIPWSVGILGVVITAFLSWMHHVNCHATGCWRKGRFPVAGGAYKICLRCHNQMHGRDDSAPVTIGHIREHHERHEAAQAGRREEARGG